MDLKVLQSNALNNNGDLIDSIDPMQSNMADACAETGRETVNTTLEHLETRDDVRQVTCERSEPQRLPYSCCDLQAVQPSSGYIVFQLGPSTSRRHNTAAHLSFDPSRSRRRGIISLSKFDKRTNAGVFTLRQCRHEFRRPRPGGISNSLWSYMGGPLKIVNISRSLLSTRPLTRRVSLTYRCCYDMGQLCTSARGRRRRKGISWQYALFSYFSSTFLLE